MAVSPKVAAHTSIPAPTFYPNPTPASLIQDSEVRFYPIKRPTVVLSTINEFLPEMYHYKMDVMGPVTRDWDLFYIPRCYLEKRPACQVVGLVLKTTSGHYVGNIRKIEFKLADFFAMRIGRLVLDRDLDDMRYVWRGEEYEGVVAKAKERMTFWIE